MFHFVSCSLKMHRFAGSFAFDPFLACFNTGLCRYFSKPFEMFPPTYRALFAHFSPRKVRGEFWESFGGVM